MEIPVTNPGLGQPMTSNVSSQFTVVSSDAVKMLVVVPGETYERGRPPYTASGGGKTGTPSMQVAGSTFTVTVRAVDPYWNVVESDISQVRIDTEDPYDVHPATAGLVNGAKTFTVKMVTNSTWTLSAVDTDDIAGFFLETNVSSPIYVNHGSPTRLQMILPGETAVPGYVNGKTGPVDMQTADESFNLTVNLCDNNWNKVVTGSMPSVELGSTDLFWSTPTARTLSAGAVVFQGIYAPKLITATTHTMTVTEVTSFGYAMGISSPVCVNPNSANQLVVIVPGETQVNGKIYAPYGKSGSPTPRTVGEDFNVTVYATDRVYNRIPGQGGTVDIQTSDLNDLNPGVISMSNGIIVTTCTLKTAAPTTVSGTHSTLGGPHQSSSMQVLPGVPKKLQVLVPGEYAAPGTPSGRSTPGGTPDDVYAGVQFTVTVNACDDYWNLASTQPIVTVWTADPYDLPDPAWTGQMFTSTTVNVAMVTKSTGTVTFPVYVEDTSGILSSHASQGITVLPGNPQKLLVIMEGESFAGGSETGKSGSPVSHTAGASFNATAAICDAYWNVAPGNAAWVRVTAPDDPYGTWPSSAAINTGNGTQVFTFADGIRRASQQYVRVEDVDDTPPLYWANNSSTFTVTPQTGIANLKLQLLLPGTTAAPGSPTGEIGTPSAQTAGVPFKVTVNLVDTYFNKNGTDTQPDVQVETSDDYAPVPAHANLVNGSNTFDVDLRTAVTSQIVTASDLGTMYQGDQSPQYTVNPSSPVQLQVLMPGETVAQGKPPYNGTAGKNGTPNKAVAGQNLQITINLTDTYYNRVKGITMPQVDMNTWDPMDSEWTSPCGLDSEGMTIQTVSPRTASSTWTVTVFDTGFVYSSGTCANVRIWPGAVHYFSINYSSQSVVAGTGFDVTVLARDTYTNYVSTGPNWDSFATDSRYIRFEAETFAPPQDATVPLDYDFMMDDWGSKLFASGITMRRAGGRWFRCYDASYSGLYVDIASDRPGFGYLTYIPVTAAAFYKIAVSTDPANAWLPCGGIEVPAGSPSNLGKKQVIGQMVDSYNNSVSSAGVQAYINIRDVAGSTGTVKDTFDTVWTSTVTNQNGTIGGDSPIYYYISTTADDYARVWIGTFTAPTDISPYLAEKKNISGQFKTTGGDPYKFGFTGMPERLTAGSKTTVITVNRYDAFDNPTKQGQNPVILWSSSLSPNKAFYWPIDNWLYDQQIIIQPGYSSAQFYYYDEMSSYPVDEDSRTGQWTLRAQGGLVTAEDTIIVDPAATTKLAFDNVKSTQVANRLYDDLGIFRYLEIETQDTYSNPTISTMTSIFVNLSSNRLTSDTSDYFGFSLSSGVTGPPPWTQTTQVEISTNSYFVRVYYRDTRASETYAPAYSGPTVHAETTDLMWQGDQTVCILADAIYKTVFISPERTLTAGVTSQVFTIQTQDMYSNPSPVKGTEPPYNGYRWGVVSNSQGDKQYYSETFGWSTSTGTVLIAMGSHTTYFWMIDTIKGNYTIEADEDYYGTGSKGWAKASQAYTVDANVPYKLEFVNPTRRLIAGTTIQYYPDYTVGTTTDTRFFVHVKDVYGNVSPVTVVTNVNVRADPPPASPGAFASIDNISYVPVNPTNSPLSITLTPGLHEAPFYFRAQAAGEVPVRVWATGLVDAVQISSVTPNVCHHFTLEHPYSVSNPVSVQEWGVITVQARDQYGNRAKGDATNGRYYEGNARFWYVADSTYTVTLSTPGFNFSINTSAEQPEPGRFINLQVMDIEQESICIGATDYANASIYGFTTDPRDVSNVDVVTVGVVVEPTDFAPEQIEEKQALGIAESLYQGDGTTISRPAPVAMLRLRINVEPSDEPLVISSATWTHVTISRQGSLNFDKIAEVDLYRDMNGDGRFNGDTILGDYNSGLDLFITSGTFSGALDDLILYLPTLGNVQTIEKSPKTYFICVRLPIDAPKNTTLGLTVPSNGLTMVGTAKLAANNLPTASYVSNVQTEPPKVFADILDVAAWYDPDGPGNPTFDLWQYPDIPQGNPAVGMMRIGLWTQEYNAIWNSLTITRTGTGEDTDVVSCRLYKDADGSKTFQYGTDLLVSPDAVFETSIANINLNTQTIGQATQYYFVVYKMADAAEVGETLGVKITADGFHFSEGEMAALQSANTQQYELFPATSTICTIVATADTLFVDRYDSASGLGIGAVTQGDTNVPFLRMRLRTDARSAIWNSLRIDRRHTGDLNKDADVSGIKVYLDAGVASLDQDLAIDTTGTVKLTTTQNFGSAGLLYVGNEIIRYSSVLSTTSVFVPESTGRGVLNTAAIEHTSGESVLATGNGALNTSTDQLVSDVAQTWVFISSTVVIPITGPKGGQEILATQSGSAECKTYFVTYDINYFATLGETLLGLDLAAPSYMGVVSPKQVSNYNIPLYSEINRVQEYSDLVTFKPEQTTLGSTLMQASTNQAVLTFTAETDKSEALFDRITVTRTGTSVDTDVNYVRIWYDGNKDTILNRGTTKDWVIGEGYFNNKGTAGDAVIDISTNVINLGAGNDVAPIVWRKLTTPSNGTMRYFVTYDINDMALPERTLGARINSASNLKVSDPNTIATTNLPFDSTLRTIVPSRRYITVAPEALNTATLASGILASAATIYVDSVANFPDSGALVIGTEVVYYDIRNTGDNCFTNLTRGAWNTLAMAHSAGDIVSCSYLQGTINAPYMKLTMSCDGFQVRWYNLVLDRLQPSGLTGNDSDVKVIKVWEDNGDGVLNRDPVTGLIGAETLVSSGTPVFGNLYSAKAKAPLIGDGKDTGGNTYILISATPTVYWITMDIDQTATKGSVIGIGCPVTDNVEVGATYPNDYVHLVVDGASVDYPGDPFPFRSGYSFIYATVDTVSINYEPILPATIEQNAQDVGVMRLMMKADANTVIWQGLRMNLTGNCVDNDVTLVKVWKDLDGDGSFTSADKAQVGNDYIGLLSYGTENFANKTCNLTLKTPQVIPSTGTVSYFVTYTINSLAPVGGTVGLSIDATGYFTVDSPDKITFMKAAPYATPNVPIDEFSDVVTFEPWPWYDPENNTDVLAGKMIYQGDQNVPVLKFRLKTDISEAIWSAMRVERIGTGAPGQPTGGTNTDIQYVKIYADSNNTGALDAGDTLITSGTDHFPADISGPTTDIGLTIPQTLRPSWQYYFVVYDISPTAYANNSIGIRIKDKSWITVSLPNSVEAFPNTLPFNALNYFDSSVAQILPLSITMLSESIAPTVKLPQDKDVPLLKLKILSSAHGVLVSSITFVQTGTIETSYIKPEYYFGIGDGDFERIKLWRDDGDGTFNPSNDYIVGNVPHRSWVVAAGLDPNTVTNFSGGAASIPCGTSVNTSGTLFFVTADIGTSDLGGKLTFRHTAGLKIENYGRLRIIPDSAVSASANAFPYASENVIIADVSILEVDIRPDKPGVQEVAWRNSNTTVDAEWSIIKVEAANIRNYRAAIGSTPDNQDATAGTWTPTDKAYIEIRGLALKEPTAVNLAETIEANATPGSISVEYIDGHPKKGVSNPTDGFDKPGHMVIGKEIISYTEKTGNTFSGITRGVYNTPVEKHVKGAKVTNRAYFVKIMAETDLAGETPQKWGVVRIDLSPPSAPLGVAASVAESETDVGVYEVKWSPSRDFESDVEVYEVQERTDTNPVWRTVDIISPPEGSTDTEPPYSFYVGDGNAKDLEGNDIADDPRERGHFFYYRVRARNNAGSWGDWSSESAPAITGLPGEVISKVSNYPNPVDTRKGGVEAQTNIVYILNQDAEVTITLYDLLGYEVYNWSFSPGSDGGKKGANRVIWDGTNELGDKVAKGGYIAHIKVKSDRGLVTAIRKIGVIH
ncbi:MAG: hypothetical protein JW803_00410 [Endomicrobiales bacterium]|nr:hypothetical protein [Endomicrobiales bacterium]